MAEEDPRPSSRYLVTVPQRLNYQKTGRYLVQLFQAVFSFDTGLLNVIIDSIEDGALRNG